MSFAPKQDWDAYHSLVNPAQIAQEKTLSASEKHERYVEIYANVCAARGTSEPVRTIRQFEEKLNLRLKLLKAYRVVTGPAGD